MLGWTDRQSGISSGAGIEKNILEDHSHNWNNYKELQVWGAGMDGEEMIS